MVFSSEACFEDAVIAILKQHGWDDADGVICYPTEQALIDNWASWLFKNNQGIDQLNGQPLTEGEMRQILEQIAALRTPNRLNGFINGKSVTITRDNPNDPLHLGTPVTLDIYDRNEIAGGKSRYQIVRQPKFTTAPMLNQRRGDLMLLINGMPVIHIELKRSGVPVSEACHQIQKYMHEGVFTGLFSLVQIFVAMTPEETVYFANPGPDGQFNGDFQFHWADSNNEPINEWSRVCAELLNIPLAHQLVGSYSVADEQTGTLKVMRSYQYYAANRIASRAAKARWGEVNPYGGFVWHTTGSGKTLTSFKSAQLIANAGHADKVVFLVDRIELGAQSYNEYNSFADEGEEVQRTEDTGVLVKRLKSNDPADTLIVTSIQKMNVLANDRALKAVDLAAISSKRTVFIVDECHRSVFGDMLSSIRRAFPEALFFGFTGTPIQEENKKHESTTSMVFGDELHRYSIADGLRDKNVLGFDPYMVCTFRDKDIRQQVALERVHAATQEEALSDPQKRSTYLKYMDPSQVPMAARHLPDGTDQEGIEKYVPSAQYTSDEHRNGVVADIQEGFATLSKGGRFHAILATSSIAEAIEYHRLFVQRAPELKVTALFDPNIDNQGESQIFKEDGLREVLEHYNALYGKDFTIPRHAAFKRDVADRLAHKGAYRDLDRADDAVERRVDLLIVVDQMLTGFDSKWINTLYLDKVLRYEGLIQAFSRTNRLCGPEKPFGTIKYYRYPHTMRQNIDDAVSLYSGDRPLALFAQKLDVNIGGMNLKYEEMRRVFETDGVTDFAQLPASHAACAEFAKLFGEFNAYLEAAKVQGFLWEKPIYEFDDPSTGEHTTIEAVATELDYLALAQRYKELARRSNDTTPESPEEVPFDIVGYLTEIDTGRIDADYMNENFTKWLKAIDPEESEQLLAELHRSFAHLSQEQQTFAQLVIDDALNGDLDIIEGKTFRDYIVEYQGQNDDARVSLLVDTIGVDREKLLGLIALHPTEGNLNEFGRFDDLKATTSKELARDYFEALDGHKIPPFKVNIRIDTLLREFVLSGGFDIERPTVPSRDVAVLS